MRVRSIGVNNARIPNELIASCTAAETKREFLRVLNSEWKRNAYRLALYDDAGNIMGIAFCDENGNLTGILSEFDMAPYIDKITRAVSGALASKKRDDVTPDRRHGAPAPSRADGSKWWHEHATAATYDEHGDAEASRYENAGDDDSDYDDYGGYDDDYEVTDGSGPIKGLTGVLTGVSDEYGQLPAQGATKPENAVRTAHNGKQRGSKRHKVLAAIIIPIALAMMAVIATALLRIGPATTLADRLGLPDMSSLVSGSDDAEDVRQIPADQMATLVVNDGDAAITAANNLRSIGMVDVANGIYGAISENPSVLASMRPGTYHVKGAETTETIIRRLNAGQLYPDGFLGVDSGSTIRTIVAKIGTGTFPFTEDELSQALTAPVAYRDSYPMLAGIPDDLPSLEGFLKAGTYDLSGVANADEAVRVLLNGMEADYEASGMTADVWFATLTEASMLDKEIMYDDEKPTVASVIDNRIAQSMPLQIDATVLYALGRDTGIPTYDDLQVDSPYNTYLRAGLPIGPICSGISQSSIDAVASHPQTQYLYYCLTPANDGHHVFATTYEEHQANQQAYIDATTSGTAAAGTQTRDAGDANGITDGADATTTQTQDATDTVTNGNDAMTQQDVTGGNDVATDGTPAGTDTNADAGTGYALQVG